jgi:hypothetical protein
VPQLLAAVADKDAAGLLDKIRRLGATGLLGQCIPQFPGKSWRERNQAQAGYQAVGCLNQDHRQQRVTILARVLRQFSLILLPKMYANICTHLSPRPAGCCLVLAVATGLRLSQPMKGVFILGTILIVLSDTIISFTEFLQYQDLNWLILPAYYLAHLSISFALLPWGRSRETAAASPIAAKEPQAGVWLPPIVQ